MTAGHTLPPIYVRETGPAARRRSKPSKIPSLCGGGKTIIPDEVIAGIRWMSENGWTHSEIAVYTQMTRRAVGAIICGQTRLHIEPHEPREPFWAWVAARWV